MEVCNKPQQSTVAKQVPTKKKLTDDDGFCHGCRLRRFSDVAGGNCPFARIEDTLEPALPSSVDLTYFWRSNNAVKAFVRQTGFTADKFLLIGWFSEITSCCCFIPSFVSSEKGKTNLLTIVCTTRLDREHPWVQIRTSFIMLNHFPRDQLPEQSEKIEQR